MILLACVCVNRMSEMQNSCRLELPVIAHNASESLEILSIQSNREHDVSEFCHSLFGIELGFGEMLGNNQLRAIRHWPHKVYVISEDSQIPQIESAYAGLITDISDAYCKLTLSGKTALLFLGQSCPLEFRSNVHLKKTVKTLCGKYPIIVWWDSDVELKLLIERSLSQSFRDYLTLLADRFCLG